MLAKSEHHQLFVFNKLNFSNLMHFDMSLNMTLVLCSGNIPRNSCWEKSLNPAKSRYFVLGHAISMFAGRIFIFSI